MNEKPAVFISHSSLDKELAHEIKRQIEQCLDTVEVFAATIKPGENWFEKVIAHLNRADAFVLLITPNSVAQSHWVWFELGYFWSRHNSALESLEERKKVYYPLYVDGVELPNPVKDLKIQAASLNDESAVIAFFEELGKHFAVVSIRNVDVEAIVQIANHTDARKPSEEAIYEILNDYFDSLYKSFSSRFNNHGEHVFTGKLIRFDGLDNELNLPTGTSKKFLKEIARKHNLVPETETGDTIRFKIGDGGLDIRKLS